MNSSTRPNVRGDEVIRLLATHEALSFGVLQRLIAPPISEKKLRDVLSRLVKKRIVRRRLFNLFGGSAVFFEIADPLRSDLNIQTVHSSLLMHNDSCALAVELLRASFPNARYVREHAIPRDTELRTVMKYTKWARDTLPDILMIVESATDSRLTYIAVEIERSTKSVKRLLRKFSKYAVRTKLDGVIYLSEDKRVLATLSDRYQKDISSNAARIRHYKDHFFVTAGCPTKQVFTFEDAQNSAKTPVSLTDWIHSLVTLPKSERKTFASFESGGVRPNP